MHKSYAARLDELCKAAEARTKQRNEPLDPLSRSLYECGIELTGLDDEELNELAPDGVSVEDMRKLGKSLLPPRYLRNEIEVSL